MYYYAEINVAEPIEKLLGDWDLLDERVIKKLSAFKELNENLIGVRRRMVSSNNEVLDPVKGCLPESLELDAERDRSTKHEMLTLNMTVGGVHRTASRTTSATGTSTMPTSCISPCRRPAPASRPIFW